MIYLLWWFGMKKNIIKCAIVAVVIAAVGGLIYAGVKINGNKKELDKHLVEINVKELKEKIDNKETFILVVTRTDCSHCEAFKPVLKDVYKEYNITGYEINTANIAKEDESLYTDLVPNIEGTPTTVFFKNGEETTVSNRIKGEVKRDKVVNRLKSLGYIEE